MTPQTDPLETLDRRAADAVAALDDAVDATPIPDLDSGDARRTLVQRVPPIAVAAALLVVAMVAALVFVDRSDDERGLAGEVEAGEPGDYVRLALPDAAASGLELTAAFDGRPAVEPGFRATLQGPADADDPWAEAVQVSTINSDPSFDNRLYGELRDIGGVDASVVPSPVGGVSWIGEDGSQHSISAYRVDQASLLDLAAEAVAAGWRTGEALPGYVVLAPATAGTTFPTLTFASQESPVDVDAIGYRNDSLAFTIGTVEGGEATYRALQVFADTEAVEVRGRPGVVVRHPGVGELVEIAWRENDATVVRVETYDDPAVVIEQLEALAPIDDTAFETLVRDHPLDDERRLLVIPDSEYERVGDPFEDTPDETLGRLDADRDGLGARILLYQNDDDVPGLAMLVDDVSGGASGSGSTVRDIAVDTAVMRTGQGEQEVFGGVVPGAIRNIDVEVGRVIRAVVDVEQAAVAGTDATLFLAWTETSDDAGSPAIVRITLTDGRVIRYAV